ncbi:hypothetical protein [Streptomyces yunnanensis]|uniref:Uncharacterized protein n=1 Tax=Streptomyces yunnanensis TaxID=156453 RepID=A0A9X8N4W8_9ACTN|nr:hypothetical protein [Streptomyces yunnanensis]SHM99738.1 hypothetical protein SAMN05216268_117103 [Streptomyces yunnanensis]
MNHGDASADFLRGFEVGQEDARTIIVNYLNNIGEADIAALIEYLDLETGE